MQAQALSDDEVAGEQGWPDTLAGRKILPGGGATVRQNLPHIFPPESSLIFCAF